MGSWNAWASVEMVRDDSEPGRFFHEVTFGNGTWGGHFIILRNDDIEQGIFPDRWSADDTAEALGPDEVPEGSFWFVEAQPGETFRVEFMRRNESGVDKKKVAWKKI